MHFSCNERGPEGVVQVCWPELLKKVSQGCG
jgi:hypothetical protein